MVAEGTISRRLLLELERRGYQGRIVSVGHLKGLQQGIEFHSRDGVLDEEFYRERLSGFRYRPPSALANPQSLIVVAVPRPETEAVFTWKGRRLSLILPPTYTDYGKVADQIASLAGEVLDPAGYQVMLSALPLKLLAVRSGLGAYGRNNLCYVPGMGSFLQLVGLYSDLPCREDGWQEVRMMEACSNCHACMRRCPSGAITEERFLLRAERCLSFHNERPGSIPFPSWIDPSWHNCLEGCMHCQSVCPENRRFLGWIEGVEGFSDVETALLLRGGPPDRLPRETVVKLERLGIRSDQGLLPRNLGVFLSG